MQESEAGKPIFDARCPLCRLALWDRGFPEDLKTKLLYQDERILIVVDLDAKIYQQRLLAVTRLGHIPCGKLSDTEASWMKMKLVETSTKLWGRGATMLLDLERHSSREHEHYQSCLVRLNG